MMLEKRPLSWPDDCQLKGVCWRTKRMPGDLPIIRLQQVLCMLEINTGSNHP